MGFRTTFDLSGRVAVVTGAGSGIGRAAAIAAAQRGAILALTDINADALDSTVNAVRQAGGTVINHAALDISDHAAVIGFADAVHRSADAVDVVMNVAGVSTWGRIQDLEHHHWRRTIDIDLMGPISVLEAFVPAMIQGGRGGQIANVSSAAGLFGLPIHAPYSAAKFGLRGVSEVLRFDLSQHRIGVSLVCPGAVDTPLVGTVDIVGVSRHDPRLAALIDKFQRHAVSPEHAAESMLRGIERRREMVFTSADVRLGYWAQRIFPFGYNIAMRALNRRVMHLIENSRRVTAATAGPAVAVEPSAQVSDLTFTSGEQPASAQKHGRHNEADDDADQTGHAESGSLSVHDPASGTG